MRISRVDVWAFDLTYVHGQYVMSEGRVIDRLSTTVVRLATDDGLEGWGEVCPLGPAYLPAHAEGARAALRELVPAVLGLDPRDTAVIGDAMDRALMGHGYAKSPLDIACWDILGQSAGVSLTTLLGGRRQERFPLYMAVPLGSREAMADYVSARRAEGIHHFQLKVGADPVEDAARVRDVLAATGDEDVIVVDANGGWRLQQAMVAARLLEPLPRVFFEQPCPTLEECLYVRRHTTLPMILDEVIVDVQSLLRAWQAGGMEAWNLKISRVGGLTKARQLRDLSESLGLRVTIEDSWGGDLTSAAVSHLAASSTADTLFTVSFMNDWTNEHIAGYQPRSQHGVGAAPAAPGLGITVDAALLGEPVFSVVL